jgi:hypothetical protein
MTACGATGQSIDVGLCFRNGPGPVDAGVPQGDFPVMRELDLRGVGMPPFMLLFPQGCFAMGAAM